MHYVVKRPLITEKNSLMAENDVYVFEVNRKANKNQVKEAIEKNFRVKVDSVRTAVCRGRARRNRYGYGNVNYWKKAMVKLKPGEKISLFEGA